MAQALYNEIEPYAAQWLRNLIEARHIAPGVVDERSITDLTPAEVDGPGQRHFFAGIGVWSYALRLVGVPDELSLWTGSCPCQPLSTAGKQQGFDDARHLWPTWFGLINACRPRVVLGEQVASKLGLAWLDLVLADLEGAGYTVRAADTCAAGVGAPHIRQRLYFVAYADGQRRDGQHAHLLEGRSYQDHAQAPRGSETHKLAHTDVARPQRRILDGYSPDERFVGARRVVDELAYTVALADAEAERRGSRRVSGEHGRAPLEPERLGASRGLGDARGARGGRNTGTDARAEASRDRAGQLVGGLGDEPRAPGPTNGFWADCAWIPCTDGKSRPVEPGLVPLVDGPAPGMGRVRTLRAPKIRGYGNAINAYQAAAFIDANLDVILP